MTSTRYDDIIPQKSYKCFNPRLTVEARAGRDDRESPARERMGKGEQSVPVAQGHLTPRSLFVPVSEMRGPGEVSIGVAPARKWWGGRA